MPEPAQSATPRKLTFKDVSSWASALSGVLGLLATITDKSKKIPLLESVPGSWIIVGSVVLLALAAFVQRRRLIRHSRLIQPEALVLHNRADHLVGRSDDIDRLLGHIEDAQLVWLVGESGAGKSALLQIGIKPRLQEMTNRLPLYVDNWGADWVQGPIEALAESLNESLRQRDPQTTTAVNPKNVLSFLESLRRDTGVVPVILFDQFDDYQLRHRDYFLIDKGSIMGAAELAEKNEFWRCIGKLLAENAVRVLFATRQDTSYALESVRFMAPVTYPLDRLRPGYTLPLLERLTKGAVENPENGWTQLTRIISQELEADGSVLPVQLRVAIRSLTSLKELTPAEYRKCGSLRGLEASDLMYHLRESGRVSGVHIEDGLNILLHMTDRATKKTVACTERELLAEIRPGTIDQNKIQSMLDYLVSRQVLRMRVNLDTNTPVWLLDHDYLCRGVLEIEKRVRQWSRVLQDAAENFEAAPGIWRKYRALLSPMAQCRILFSRLRRRLVYGPYRRYALLSTVRFVTATPKAMAYFIVALMFSYVTVLGVAGFIESGPSMSTSKATSASAPAPYSKLWKASQLDYSHRIQMLTPDYIAASAHDPYYSRPPISAYVIAIVGLDNTARTRFITDEVKPCYGLKPPLSKADCETLIRSLDSSSDAAREYYLTPLLSATSAEAFRESLSSLPGPPFNIPASTLQQIVDRGCSFIRNDSDAYRPRRLADSLLKLGGLTHDGRAAIGSALIAFFARNPNATSMYSDLEQVVADLNSADQATLRNLIVDRINQSGRTGFYSAAADLKLINGRLSPTDSAKVVDAFAQVDPIYFRSAVDSLSNVSNKLAPDQVSRAFNLALRIEAEKNFPYCATLGPLATGAEVQQLVNVLKWPTCADADRRTLVGRIGELRNSKFKFLKSDDYVWQFADWARRQGLDLTTSPTTVPAATP